MNRDPKTGRRSWGRVRAGEYPEIPALKRGVWSFLAWTMFGVAMTLAYVALTIYWFNAPKWAAGAAIPTTIFQSIGAWRWVRWNRRVRDTVNQPHGELCLHCLYPIAGLGDSGRCPECGKAFELANVRRVWSEFKV